MLLPSPAGASPSPEPVGGRYITCLLSRGFSVRAGPSERQHVPVQTQANVGGGGGEASSGGGGSTDTASTVPPAIEPVQQHVVVPSLCQAGAPTF